MALVADAYPGLVWGLSLTGVSGVGVEVKRCQELAAGG